LRPELRHLTEDDQQALYALVALRATKIFAKLFAMNDREPTSAPQPEQLVCP
jgi:hypothetical protein